MAIIKNRHSQDMFLMYVRSWRNRECDSSFWWKKDLGTKKQHKINGYAIADNYETVDLFISIYGCEESIYSTPKTEIDRASTRIINFFRKAVYGDYANEVAESSEIFWICKYIIFIPRTKKIIW